MIKKKDNKKGSRAGKKPEQEFEQKIIDLARITRVMAGGKRMRFRACVCIGDKKGRVAIGLAKGADVTVAVNKAVNKAQKQWITVPIINETIPHEIRTKLGAARLLLKPAPTGTGVRAGGAVRVVLELAGVPNIVGKIMGTNNKVNNVKALISALSSFNPDAIRKARNKQQKKDNKNKAEVTEDSVKKEEDKE